MSKAIKVSDGIYDSLDLLRGKSETFSEVIAGLLGAREEMLRVLNHLEGVLKFQEWQRQKLQELEAASQKRTQELKEVK